MRDFTLEIYSRLCKNILNNGFKIVPVVDFIENTNCKDKIAIFRHDVDKRPRNALRMAILENKLGFRSTYYFRTVKEVFNPWIIKEIESLGHEIGYHYEVLANSKGDKKKAIVEFQKELKKLREICEIKTIVMHGSPLSPWRDSELWTDFSFEDYGIKAEAYLSINYNDTYYYTDTGRTWYEGNHNVRDKPVNKSKLDQVNISSTNQLIELLPTLNRNLAINTHPQRWTDSLLPWINELVLQNVKNIGKSIIVNFRKKGERVE